jgi:hypothetical protein
MLKTVERHSSTNEQNGRLSKNRTINVLHRRSGTRQRKEYDDKKTHKEAESPILELVLDNQTHRRKSSSARSIKNDALPQRLPRLPHRTILKEFIIEPKTSYFRLNNRRERR